MCIYIYIYTDVLRVTVSTLICVLSNAKLDVRAHTMQDDIYANLQLVLEAVSSALAPKGADLTELDSIR